MNIGNINNRNLHVQNTKLRRIVGGNGTNLNAAT